MKLLIKLSQSLMIYTTTRQNYSKKEKDVSIGIISFFYFFSRLFASDFLYDFSCFSPGLTSLLMMLESVNFRGDWNISEGTFSKQLSKVNLLEAGEVKGIFALGLINYLGELKDFYDRI